MRSGKRVLVIRAVQRSLGYYHLARLGHDVECGTPGLSPSGMMRWHPGVPDAAVPRRLEIGRLTTLGVGIISNLRVVDLERSGARGTSAYIRSRGRHLSNESISRLGAGAVVSLSVSFAWHRLGG